jgi:hypothetical protein
MSWKGETGNASNDVRSWEFWMWNLKLNGNYSQPKLLPDGWKFLTRTQAQQAEWKFHLTCSCISYYREWKHETEWKLETYWVFQVTRNYSQQAEWKFPTRTFVVKYYPVVQMDEASEYTLPTHQIQYKKGVHLFQHISACSHLITENLIQFSELTTLRGSDETVRIDGPRGDGWIGPFSKSKRNMETTQPMQSYKGQFTANLLKQEGKTTLSKTRHGKKHNKQRYKLQVWNAWMQRRGKETTGFFLWYR